MSLSCWLSIPRGSSSVFSLLNEKTSLLFLFFQLLHSSALLFVPQSSHSRPADIWVSLSSIAPSEWLSPPSEESLYFLGFRIRRERIISSFVSVSFPRTPDCVIRGTSGHWCCKFLYGGTCTAVAHFMVQPPYIKEHYRLRNKRTCIRMNETCLHLNLPSKIPKVR